MTLDEIITNEISESLDETLSGLGNVNSIITDNINNQISNVNNSLDGMNQIAINLIPPWDFPPPWFPPLVPIFDIIDPIVPVVAPLVPNIADAIYTGIVKVLTWFMSFQYNANYDIKILHPREPLSLNDYAELYNRGFITKAAFDKGAARSGFTVADAALSNILYAKFLGINEYTDLFRKGFIPRAKLNDLLSAQGYNRVVIDDSINLTLLFHDLNDYITLYRRELITIEVLTAFADKLGYNTERLNEALTLSLFHPSPRDLIDFAVREAFEPEAELFIHGGNAIPEPFLIEGKKVGLSNDWIKKFWHSHWQLLSVGQILDAWHRKIIDDPFKDDYLRRLDYTENDREILSGLSYNLLTRVDVRRLYENGIINTSELLDYYESIGFSNTDKIHMTRLSKQLRFIDMKDLRSHYIEQFEGGLLTESVIRNLLKGTGLDSDEVDSYLDLSESNKELEFKLELKKQIEGRFYEGVIDYDELIKQLRGLGVSNREISRIERNAVLYNYRKPKLPTIAELKRYIKKDIITLEKFIYYALRLGYSTEIIEMIAKDIGIIPI